MHSQINLIIIILIVPQYTPIIYSTCIICIYTAIDCWFVEYYRENNYSVDQVFNSSLVMGVAIVGAGGILGGLAVCGWSLSIASLLSVAILSRRVGCSPWVGGGVLGIGSHLLTPSMSRYTHTHTHSNRHTLPSLRHHIP